MRVIYFLDKKGYITQSIVVRQTNYFYILPEGQEFTRKKKTLAYFTKEDLEGRMVDIVLYLQRMFKNKNFKEYILNPTPTQLCYTKKYILQASIISDLGALQEAYKLLDKYPELCI